VVKFITILQAFEKAKDRDVWGKVHVRTACTAVEAALEWHSIGLYNKEEGILYRYASMLCYDMSPIGSWFKAGKASLVLKDSFVASRV